MCTGQQTLYEALYYTSAIINMAILRNLDIIPLQFNKVGIYNSGIHTQAQVTTLCIY
jgi:hypothetical protein